MSALTQAEADVLLRMPKRPAAANDVGYPHFGRKVSVNLLSADRRESFQLSVGRSYVKITKATFQTRARSTVVLARLDLDGAPHTNPDGTELACPHLHVYREGYGDRWAVEVPEASFANLSDQRSTLTDFMAFCAIEGVTFRFDLLS